MSTSRTTISLPVDLVREFQSIIGTDKSFSEQVRMAILAYIAQYKRAQYVREMEESYQKYADVFHQSAAEHKHFRTECTDSFSSSS